MSPTRLRRTLDSAAAATGFSGVIRYDDASGIEVAQAYGLADRRHGIPNTVETRFGIASGGKGVTAVTVMSLVVDGTISLETRARTLLGDDLPLIDDRVTVEHLLAHRSGIGDYLDESAGDPVDAYLMPVPLHRLATTEGYLSVLDGHPQVFDPGSRFAYNNGGYVVLALLAERATGMTFADLVARRVLQPAGMVSSGFLRSDELPADAAVGYLDEEGLRTNVHHLPVRGSGDGGLYSTAHDIRALWLALLDGALLPADAAREMVRPRSDSPSGPMRYGLGFWLDHTGPGIVLTGYDAGVSFWSHHDPMTGATLTILANTSEGAWPVRERLATAGVPVPSGPRDR
jgi:CubicO group peptidase (beta-lactamase class C family)